MRVKRQDHQASQIRWGIELETRIPTTAGVNVGGYHRGNPVQVGIDKSNTLPVNAPSFQGDHRWKAERDGSIRCSWGCPAFSPASTRKPAKSSGVSRGRVTSATQT